MMQYEMANAGDDDDDGACCNCGLKATRLKVSKEGGNTSLVCGHLPLSPHLLFAPPGPNQGRAFYKCSKVSKASQCDYFSWADGPDRGAPSSAARGTDRDRPNAGGGAGGPAPSGDCFNCGECAFFCSAFPDL